MSMADYIEEQIMLENMIKNRAIEVYSERYSGQKVVDDAICSFRKEPLEIDNPLELLAQDILKTVVRLKKISIKQHQVLVRFLVNRECVGYEQRTDL